jgi:hypothetical protein
LINGQSWAVNSVVESQLTGRGYAGRMNNEQNRYYAYLLRLWPENVDSQGAASWRATLEDAHTGERLGFANLEQLFTHLMQLAEGHSKGSTEASDPQSPTQ